MLLCYQATLPAGKSGLSSSVLLLSTIPRICPYQILKTNLFPSERFCQLLINDHVLNDTNLPEPEIIIIYLDFIPADFPRSKGPEQA